MTKPNKKIIKSLEMNLFSPSPIDFSLENINRSTKNETLLNSQKMRLLEMGLEKMDYPHEEAGDINFTLDSDPFLDSLMSWRKPWKIQIISDPFFLYMKQSTKPYKVLYVINDIRNINKLESDLNGMKFNFKLALLPWYESEVDLSYLIKEEKLLSPFRFFNEQFNSISRSNKLSLDSYVSSFISIMTKVMRNELIKGNMGFVSQSEDGEYLIYSQIR